MRAVVPKNEVFARRNGQLIIVYKLVQAVPPPQIHAGIRIGMHGKVLQCRRRTVRLWLQIRFMEQLAIDPYLIGSHAEMIPRDADNPFDQAVAEYKAALAARDGQLDTRLAAERGLRSAYAVKGHSCSEDDADQAAPEPGQKPANPPSQPGDDPVAAPN